MPCRPFLVGPSRGTPVIVDVTHEDGQEEAVIAVVGVESGAQAEIRSCMSGYVANALRFGKIPMT